MAQTNGEAVNLRDKVKVVGISHKEAGKQKLVPGKVYHPHPLTAKNLVETGHAKYADESKADKKK